MNIVKMNILPTINYILRMFSVTIPKAWFDDLHKAISTFIWHGKKARCSYLRMSSPNKIFVHYNLSFGCQQVNMLFDPSVIKDWKTIEENMLQSLNIDTKCLNFMKLLPKEMTGTSIEVSFNILKSCIKIPRINTDTSINQPIWQNSNITVNKKVINWKKWKDNGVTKLCHILSNSRFKTFGELMTEYDIPKSEYLNDITLQHSIEKCVSIDNLSNYIHKFEKVIFSHDLLNKNRVK